MRRLLIALMLCLIAACAVQAPEFAAVAAPPANAQFDYQIAAPYTPNAEVGIVNRDWRAQPVRGRYNICYMNAFQSQESDLTWWERKHPRLLLKKNGQPVVDEDWNEVLFDVSTKRKRKALAKIVRKWTDSCASRGFDAVEFDNLDSYHRSRGRLKLRHNLAFARKITRHAHSAGLAVGQKNTPELGSRGKTVAGFDFAIAEECQRYLECDEYTQVFGDRVIEIEYTDYPYDVFSAACATRGSVISIILRDRFVSTAGDPEYRYESC